MHDSLSHAITQIASALSPNETLVLVVGLQLQQAQLSLLKIVHHVTSNSELNNLKLSGLLNEEEYSAEREAIMDVLEKLN